MLLTIEETKPFIRVDYDDDDSLIELLIKNAEIYLRDSVNDFEDKLKDERFKSKCKLAMLILAKHWYDNRDFVQARVDDKTSYSVKSILMQMNYSYGDSNEI